MNAALSDAAPLDEPGPERPTMPQVAWLPCRDANSAHAELLVGADLAQFDGHFPDYALLPGVTLVDWAIALGRMRFELPPHFLRVDALKFKRPVLAGTVLSVALQWHAERSRLDIAYASPQGRHADARITFGESHA